MKIAATREKVITFNPISLSITIESNNELLILRQLFAMKRDLNNKISVALQEEAKFMLDTVYSKLREQV